MDVARGKLEHDRTWAQENETHSKSTATASASASPSIFERRSALVGMTGKQKKKGKKKSDETPLVCPIEDPSGLVQHLYDYASLASVQ
jgi:hypothetical protein